MHIINFKFIHDTFRVSRISTCQTCIIVACNDIDAICACKLLVSLYKTQCIIHRIIPVAGYSEAKKAFDSLNEDIINVILLGFGAIVNIAFYFGLSIDDADNNDNDDENEDENRNGNHNRSNNFDPYSDRKIYIFDGHRPWSLENLLNEDKVYCIDTELSENLKSVMSAYTELIKLGIESDSDSDSDSNSDSDSDSNSDTDADQDESSDNDADANSDSSHTDVDEEISDSDNETNKIIRNKKKQKNKDLDNSFNENEKDDQFDVESSSQKIGRKRRLNSIDSIDSITNGNQNKQTRKKKNLQIKALKKKYNNIIREYYEGGTSISESVSALMYAFLASVGETSNSSLWFSIIGTSSYDSLNPVIYEKTFIAFHDEINRLNSSLSSHLNTADNMSLIIEPDFRLFLLRNWTLYDSIINSNYLCTKMRLWTDDGKKKLHTMLAKMGISLVDAQQKWMHTSVELKRSLTTRFENVADLFGIEDLFRPGILRKYGYRELISAFDCVESLVALLEGGAPPDFDGNYVKKEVFNKSKKSQSISSNEDDTNNTENSERETIWVENFWVGWDALNNYALLNAGLQSAKKLQQAIIRTGSAVLEKKKIRLLRFFRLAVIKDGPEIELFCNYIALCRLAWWLSDACSEAEDISFPFVLAVLDSRTSTYIVIGLSERSQTFKNLEDNTDKKNGSESNNKKFSSSNSSPKRNMFGLAFQNVAQQTEARIKIDSFESSCVEIAKDDISNFLEALTMYDM